MAECILDDQGTKYLLKKHVLSGISAGLALLTTYFLVLTVANSLSHSLEQFREMWPWITLLVSGFGVQVGLYMYIRSVMKLKKDAGVATASVAAAGGISTTSMIACCVHHLTDVLPILGLSAAAVFLNQFQSVFIIVGVLSNLVGINLMLQIIQKHALFQKQQVVLSYLMRVDMKKSLYVVSILSALTFLWTLYKSL